MSHTPGPWRPGFKNIGHVTAENGAVIAKCERLTSLVNLQDNARLIAAAPELLEAVDYCRDLLMRYEINRVDGEEIAEAALAKLNKAIAKATGQ